MQSMTLLDAILKLAKVGMKSIDTGIQFGKIDGYTLDDLKQALGAIEDPMYSYNYAHVEDTSLVGINKKSVKVNMDGCDIYFPIDRVTIFKSMSTEVEPETWELRMMTKNLDMSLSKHENHDDLHKAFVRVCKQLDKKAGR